MRNPFQVPQHASFRHKRGNNNSRAGAHINGGKTGKKSDYLTTGPQVQEFEKKLCAVTGANYAVVCSNGTAALHLACLALGIGKEDLGLTSPITFLASANCIEYCGGKADFVDIDPNTFCLSPDGLVAHCEEVAVPKVVIPVDFAGVPADLPRIKEISKKYGFKIIEDAAHAIGSTYQYKGKEYQCGSCVHSDVAILSFHPVKTITSGEGGAVLTNNPEIAERLIIFRNHGMVRASDNLKNDKGGWYYEMTELGYNYRITDIQCALGISQLKRLDEFKKRRQVIFNIYSDAFAEVDGLILPVWPKNTSPSYHLYTIQFKEGFEKRRAVYDNLRKKNILSQVHYIPVYYQPYYEGKYGKRNGLCPNAEKYYSRCLSLPLYPSLNKRDIDFIIQSLKENI